jgi:hypothetical protein
VYQEIRMTGDAAKNNDEELLGQIDELKARMDRLMKGGTSTSNSALLADAQRSTSPPVVESRPTPAPPPPRTTVRDLIGPADSEVVEPFSPDDQPAVSFPSEGTEADESRPAGKEDEDRPSSPPPPSRPAPPPVDGSLIAVDESRNEPRPKVASFDELGSAIEQELARDVSVPPASERKGPDLASRFGPAEGVVATPPHEEEIPEVEKIDASDEVDDHDEEVDFGDERAFEPVGAPRRNIGALVAIWVFTAVTSGAIATLHFTGVI